MKKIWVFADQREGQLNSVVFELLAKAEELAASYKDEVVKLGAVLIGGQVSGLAAVLAEGGADAVYIAEDERLNLYSSAAYSPIIAELVKKENPDIFLFGATSIGSELAPTVAAMLKVGVAAHCIDLRINKDGILTADVPAFGGKIIGEISMPECRPQMASVKAGIFKKGEQRLEKKAEIVQIKLPQLECVNNCLKPISLHKTQGEAMPIEEAEVIVAGGYGTGSKENWALLKELAGLLGGAVGATRPCIDEGWAESEQIMIGTSGKSVRPKTYLGFGISGSTHHVCGMKDSGLVISVNKDAKAPIFDVSDYYAAVDMEKVLKVLIEKIKNSKQSHLK